MQQVKRNYIRKLELGTKILLTDICLCFQVYKMNKQLLIDTEKMLFEQNIKPFYLNSSMLFKIAHQTNLKFLKHAAKGPFMMINLANTASPADILQFVKTLNKAYVFFGAYRNNIFLTPRRLELFSAVTKIKILESISQVHLQLLFLLYHKTTEKGIT